MIKINRLTRDDIENILPDIRTDDVVECELVAGKSIDDILIGAEHTTESYAASIHRRVIALFGVNIHSGQTLAWMVGTDELMAMRHHRAVVRMTKAYVRYFIRKYGVLTNVVCTQNRKAVRFLQMLGARFGEVEYDINDRKFKQFWLGG